VDVHLHPEVISVAGPRYLNLAIPVPDRGEEEVYLGFLEGRDANLACGVFVTRGRNDRLAIIAENGNINP